MYDLSFALSDYKYNHVAGRLHSLGNRNLQPVSLRRYAGAECVDDFKNNITCGLYGDRARSVDMHLSIVSGNEISSVPNDEDDDPDKGRRFLTHYNATMVLRNL